MQCPLPGTEFMMWPECSWRLEGQEDEMYNQPKAEGDPETDSARRMLVPQESMVKSSGPRASPLPSKTHAPSHTSTSKERKSKLKQALKMGRPLPHFSVTKTIAARREHFSVLKVKAAQRKNAKLSSLSPSCSLLPSVEDLSWFCRGLCSKDPHVARMARLLHSGWLRCQCEPHWGVTLGETGAEELPAGSC